MGKNGKSEEEVKCVVCIPDEKAGVVSKEVKERILEKIGEKLQRLEGRSNVVLTRLNDEDMKQLDALVEIELFKSRSEAVAFFVHEGIQARKDLFEKVMPTVEKIRQLKEQVKRAL
jgi:Arc/MetJ-type ribon-helix-helix transcriptional regulator